MNVTILLSPESLRAMQRYTGAAGIVMQAIRRATNIQHRITVGQIQQNRMQGDKSSPPLPPAQGVLRMITGRLRKSLDFSPAKIDGTVVTSSIGSNVSYAARHEYGFEGVESVRPFMRKSTRKMTFLGKAPKQKFIWKAPKAAKGFNLRTLKWRTQDALKLAVRQQQADARSKVAKLKAAAKQAFISYLDTQRSTITRRVRGADINVKGFTRQANTPARAPIRRGIEDCLPLYEAGINAAVIASMKTDTE